MQRSLWWSSWVVLAVGCGGRVDTSGHEPETPPKTTPSQDDEAKASGSDNPDADTDLGNCKLGYEETFTKACPWAVDAANKREVARCYDTREMACNCACPRNRNSQCSSDFEQGPDGHVRVYCF